jgi:hypothetical protein
VCDISHKEHPLDNKTNGIENKTNGGGDDSAMRSVNRLPCECAKHLEDSSEAIEPQLEQFEGHGG